MGFRLRNTQISGHQVLKGTNVIFCDDEKSYPVVYTTGIIGANGTGKSYLMAAIATIFSEINKVKETGKPSVRRFSFTIDYEYEGDLYSVSNVRMEHSFRIMDVAGSQYNTIYAKKNGHNIEIDRLRLPERVIASTMTVTE